MIVVVHGDDDAVKTREFWHRSADLLESWLRQRLHIDLARKQAGEEQVAGAAEILDCGVKLNDASYHWLYSCIEVLAQFKRRKYNIHSRGQYGA